ncbi:hypothetical protein J6X15_02140 [Candidatus Saccharibacteria bacterium]|nr:hypothetical protein [Candidatus Saccharibacteria bacterium]MBP5656361.1 hypothetical protein [Candidatus Saccharibacteria bacterium]
MESIWEKFSKMYREKDQVGLLTWAYVIISVAVVIVAGLIALINQSVGVAILIIPLVAVAAMCANVMVWSLIRFILQTHETKEKAKQRAAKQAAKKTK